MFGVVTCKFGRTGLLSCSHVYSHPPPPPPPLNSPTVMEVDETRGACNVFQTLQFSSRDLLVDSILARGGQS